MVNSIFGILFLHLFPIFGVDLGISSLDSTFWHLNLTDQLNKSLYKSNQLGANEGRMLGQFGQIPVT